ncbi:MAG: hypothetical protein A3F16_05370 [Deltaproteobacteria bacterium RIFCSPHIGHO2_12_FULL_43_9]|nr:MAG: hypothetical protein A3F16_05370 [Deltaproteobacteria bacterium RIFCSPHIGHO2_12_FULL_43_9]
MSQNKKYIPLIFAILLVLIFLAAAYLKFPAKEDIFEFPETSKNATKEQPESVTLSPPPGTTLMSKTSNGRQQPSSSQEESTPQEYEEGFSLSEEALYNISSKTPTTKKGTTTKNDRIPSNEQALQAEEPQITQPQQPPSSLRGAEGDEAISGSLASLGMTQEQPSTPDTGHGTTQTGEPTQEETLVASTKPTTPGGSTEGGTGTTTTQSRDRDVEFFKEGDQQYPLGWGRGSLALDRPEHIPEIGEVKETGGSGEFGAPSAVQAIYTPDEISQEYVTCSAITTAAADQFQTITFDHLEFNTDNPALNRFDTLIPFSILSKFWQPGTPLVLGVAIYREDSLDGNAYVTFARWLNLPLVINPDSTFDFSALAPRLLRSPTQVRYMLWVGEENICNNPEGLNRLSTQIRPEPGKIYPISTTSDPQSTKSQEQKSLTPSVTTKGSR